MAARPRLERGPPGSEPGVVPVPPPRIASGREGSNLQPPAPEAGALPLRHVQVVLTAGLEPALARLSTSCLSRLGYVSRCVLTVGFEPTLTAVWAPCLSRLGYVSVDRAGFEPATFSLQGSCASSLRHRPMVAGAGVEPACEAYETSLIPDLPQCARLPPPEAAMG